MPHDVEIVYGLGELARVLDCPRGWVLAQYGRRELPVVRREHHGPGVAAADVPVWRAAWHAASGQTERRA